MVAMDRSLSLKGATRGGFFKSLARKVLNDETFFQQVVEAGDRPGEILLAPNLPGDVTLLDVGDRQYYLSDGAFLASTSGVEFETKTQSLGRALLGDSGGFFVMKTSGSGTLAVSGFGSVRELPRHEGASDDGRQQARRRLGRGVGLRAFHQLEQVWPHGEAPSFAALG